eukprot:TRINITY_DN63296_c0_g1_i1.p1 TRINITY_DN63296_c0_g1~~TRINITY_DN63296_c0_g1_i1.p1  ORF type:complete len:189 (-),score=24.33 TRINITY_DN63296_c0_g1_i1:462-971(-)
MGCFAFECAKCGQHPQEEIVRSCVVKMGKVYVKGEYLEDGSVEIRRGGSRILVYLEQFREYFESWQVPSDALVAATVYCSDPCSRICVPRRVRVLKTLPAPSAGPTATTRKRQRLRCQKHAAGASNMLLASRSRLSQACTSAVVHMSKNASHGERSDRSGYHRSLRGLW